MLAVPMFSGAASALNFGLKPTGGLFSTDKRIMAVLINQLASLLEITILQS